MKILFAGRYNEDFVFSGPEKVADRIYNLASKEYDTAFITYFFDGNKSGIFEKIFGKKALKINGSQNVYRLGLIRLLFFALKFKPDIIHIITFERFACILFLFKIILKVKIIYNVHGIVKYENNYNSKSSSILKIKDSFCEKIIFRYSDKLIFLSEISKQTAGKYYNYNFIDSVIIPNGIDKIFFETGKNKKYSGKIALKLVFIGDYRKAEKGFNSLLTSLKEIDFKIDLFVIGTSESFETPAGEMESNMFLKLIYTKKMTTEKFADFLSDKDIYISASIYEQFSISAVESMAAGLIPFVTPETGMSSYVSDDENGFIINFENNFLKNLNRLRSDENLVRDISVNAKKIYNVLSWENVFNEYKLLYK